MPTTQDTNKEYLQNAYKADVAAGRPVDAAMYGLSPSEVSVISSNQGKVVLDKQIDEHNKEMRAFTGGVSPGNINSQGSAEKIVNGEKVKNPGYTDPYAGMTKIFNSKTGGQSYISAGATPGPDWVTADEAAATGIKIPADTTKNNQQSSTDIYDSQERDIESAFSGFDKVYDASTAAIVNSIKESYKNQINDERQAIGRAKNTTANYLRNMGFTGLGVSGVLSGIEEQGLNKIKKLNLEENEAVAKSQAALLDKKYSIFVDKRNQLKDIRQKKVDALLALQKDNEKRQDESKRAQSIVDQMNKGVTDPKAILTNLNRAGFAYTAKDVEDTLKALNPYGDLTKLSADSKDFFVLKAMGGKALPVSITSLPEDQQLMAYIKMKADAARKPGVTPKGPAGDKITAAEATKYGYPPEMIGMDEKEIRISLKHPEPPQWFIDLMKNKTNGDRMYNDEGIVVALWSDFRNEAEASLGPKAPALTGDERSRDRAYQYFSKAYPSLPEDDLQHFADIVEFEIQGGTSYPDAIQKAIRQNSASVQ